MLAFVCGSDQQDWLSPIRRNDAFKNVQRALHLLSSTGDKRLHGAQGFNRVSIEKISKFIHNAETSELFEERPKRFESLINADSLLDIARCCGAFKLKCRAGQKAGHDAEPSFCPCKQRIFCTPISTISNFKAFRGPRSQIRHFSREIPVSG